MFDRYETFIKEADGAKYYYDSNGQRVTGWRKIYGDWYYFNYPGGSMGWSKVVDEYYLGSDGKWVRNEGWQQDDKGTWYYVGRHEKVVKGWNRIDGKFYYFNYPGGSMTWKNTIDGFYLDNSGKMVNGTGWLQDGLTEDWYYFSDGGITTGWKQDGESWYYLDSNGKMVTGWKDIDGFCYYFHSDGSMATGWIKDDNGWYYLYSDGSMTYNNTVNGYHLNSSGKMVTGTGWKYVDSWWYYFKDDGRVATDWLYDQGNWYYLYPQGSMAEDTTVNGWYVDDSGRWITDEDANNDTNSGIIIENVQKLEELAKAYYGTDSTYKINTGVMNVIRRKYNGLKWTMTAYPLDTGFIKYVRENDEELLDFFSDNGEGASLIDPKTGGKIDFLHFAATLNTEFTSHPGPGCVSAELSDLAGWAGDLQQSIGDIQKAQINDNIGDNIDDLTNIAKGIIGANVSSFSASDMLADVDARNIGVNLKSDSGLLLSQALQNYYSNGENSRYTTFVDSYGGIDNLQKVVDGVTIDAWDPLTRNILNGNKISGISNNQLEALNKAFMEYVENQTLNE